MAKEITSNVEALEGEAEKILQEAKTRASETLVQAREEAKRILSSQLPLDEVKIECDKIVSRARAEANDRIKNSEQKAAEISTAADRKVNQMVERLVNIVMGRS